MPVLIIDLMKGYLVTTNNNDEYLGHAIEIRDDYVILHIAGTEVHQYIAFADILTAIPITPYWMDQHHKGRITHDYE